MGPPTTVLPPQCLRTRKSRDDQANEHDVQSVFPVAGVAGVGRGSGVGVELVDTDELGDVSDTASRYAGLRRSRETLSLRPSMSMT